MEYKRTLLNFSYVLPDFLAGMAKPGALDNLGPDLAFLKDEGIKAILSLSETGLDEDTLRESGFQYLHIPIPDFTAPTIEQVEQGIEFLERMIEVERKPVAVHCGAGCGRTGTFLACYFVKQGKLPDEAIHHVRSLRPCSIETGSQRELVYRYADYLKQGKKS
jgi:atypical dual specificity phosphatase